jgi:hypothetical protein
MQTTDIAIIYYQYCHHLTQLQSFSVTPGQDEYGARKLKLIGYPTLLTKSLLCWKRERLAY